MEEHSMRIAICDDDKLCIKNTEQYLNCISEVDFEYDIAYKIYLKNIVNIVIFMMLFFWIWNWEKVKSTVLISRI